MISFIIDEYLKTNKTEEITHVGTHIKRDYINTKLKTDKSITRTDYNTKTKTCIIKCVTSKKI